MAEQLKMLVKVIADKYEYINDDKALDIIKEVRKGNGGKLSGIERKPFLTLIRPICEQDLREWKAESKLKWKTDRKILKGTEEPVVIASFSFLPSKL